MWLMLLACTAVESPSYGWLQTWADEFEGAADSPIDPANWVHDVGGDGWGNEQLEYDTDRVENVSLDGDGNLRIRAIREDYKGNEWTSGRITTSGLFEQAEGRFEASVQLPAGRGMWPAFWMLGANFDDVGWPSCGEIDILEGRGESPSWVQGALHGPGYSGATPLYGNKTFDEDLTAGFHTYAVEWDAEYIAWFVDDTLLYRAHAGNLPENTSWVFDHPFFMILNVAVGGTFVQPPDETTPDTAEMLVDYVRVYERDR